MKIAQGPRPWTVHVFAAVFLLVGAWELFYGLTKLHRFRIQFQGAPLSEDGLIVYLSAQFTIVCIPVVAIWLLGSRIARWLITIMTLWTTSVFLLYTEVLRFDRMAGMNPLDVWDIVGTKAAYLAAMILLFHPASRPWFRKSEQIDVSAFS